MKMDDFQDLLGLLPEDFRRTGGGGGLECLPQELLSPDEDSFLDHHSLCVLHSFISSSLPIPPCLPAKCDVTLLYPHFAFVPGGHGGSFCYLMGQLQM